MKAVTVLKCAIFINIWLYAYTLFAHDVPVHWAITANATASALESSVGYTMFLNTVSGDCNSVSATNWIVLGSGLEDAPVKGTPLDSGGYRSINHFYDPLDLRFGKGLSDSPPDRRVVIGTNSFDWGAISNCLGYNYYGAFYMPFFGKNVGTSNTWSWQNARGYELVGLTSSDPTIRSNSLTSMFRAVGQVTHLLEDTTQPQHVRNEQHLEGSIWESPIEDYGLSNIATLNFQHGMLDWKGAGFTKLEDFWDRHLYNGSSAALNAETNGGTNALGLAEWCNGNFVGDRHTYAEYFQTNDIGYYPYPALSTSTSFSKVRGTLGFGVRTVFLKNKTLINRVYVDKTGDGVTFANHSVLTYLGVRNRKGNFLRVSSTIRDANVLSSYHSVFIPKAVEYSAGLMDYFFRGTLSVNTEGVDTNNSIITNLVVNTSSQSFSGGTFRLFYDDTNNIRYELTNGFSTTYSGTLASNDSITIVFPKTNAVKYMVMYQGSVGATDPIDNGIAISAKTFILGTNVWNNSFENDVSIEPNVGEYFCDGWHVDSGSIDVGTNGAWGDGLSMAYEGNCLLDLDGSGPGTISTNISTTAGQTYEVTFAWCRNPDSYDGGGGIDQPVHVPSAQVLINGTVVGVLVGNMLNSWSDLQWQQASYVFTATSSSTKLTFHSLDDSSSFSGIQLDAVYLKQSF